MSIGIAIEIRFPIQESMNKNKNLEAKGPRLSTLKPSPEALQPAANLSSSS